MQIIKLTAPQTSRSHHTEQTIYPMSFCICIYTYGHVFAFHTVTYSAGPCGTGRSSSLFVLHRERRSRQETGCISINHFTDSRWDLMGSFMCFAAHYFLLVFVDVLNGSVNWYCPSFRSHTISIHLSLVSVFKSDSFYFI